MSIMTYDIGTSSVKVSIFSNEGILLSSVSSPLYTKVEGRSITQDPHEWWNKFLNCAKKCLMKAKSSIDTLTIIGTGQMEDTILIDNNERPLKSAILYSDSNIGDYELPKDLKNILQKEIPNQLDDYMPLTKLFFLYDTSPELLARTKHIILGAKDFINFKLTGISCTDPTNATTTGLFDMYNGQWSSTVLEYFDGKLPKIYFPSEQIGIVKKDILSVLGLKHPTIVLNGIGDVGAVTLGAGIFEVGDSYSYLGTTGWIATLSNQVSQNRELFSLASICRGEWIIVGPLLNAGNVYEWAMKMFLGTKDHEKAKVALTHYKMTNVQVWPYLNGERSPYKNNKVRSIVTRISQGTTREELFTAYVRSIAFALRHVFDSMESVSLSLTMKVTGGMVRSQSWCELLSNVLCKEIKVIKNEISVAQKGLYYLYLLDKGSEMPSVEIEKSYYPSNCQPFELLYKEYKFYANRMLQNKECFPIYLAQ